ncbi:tyrosine-type recombinase/integrase [Corynebacterium striatum]|uniref:tyrosine-type recombinase/integrase n=1 Tax=Corynebacterium striatum TaxID=43770 RepID=UPI0038D0A4CD
MAYGGLRRGEVARVRGSDVQGQWLRVEGKGGHVRLVPLPPHLARRIAAHGDSWLFPGQINGHLSPRRVTELVGEVLPVGVTPHALRHRFATRVYAQSGDIVALSMLLGHAKLDTTMVYTQVDSVVQAQAAAGAWTLAAS